MNQTRTCPRCRHANLGSNSFCASCGAGLKGGHAWKLLFGLFALVVGFVWGAALFNNRQGAVRTEPLPAVQSLAGASATPAAQSAPLALTSAQHLAEARRALADGYKPNKDPRKASWGKVAAARWHLESIKPADAEYADAQALLKEVAGREKSVELAAKAAAAQAAPTPVPSAAKDADSAEADHEEVESSPSDATPRRTEQPAQSGAVERARTTAGSGGTTSSDYYTNVDGERVRRPTFSSSVPEGASAQCRDGSYSFSRNRRGTCSHHGGVARWL